jgi:hypothetical protein
MKMVKSLLLAKSMLGCSPVEPIISRSGPKFGPAHTETIIEGAGFGITGDGGTEILDGGTIL